MIKGDYQREMRNPYHNYPTDYEKIGEDIEKTIYEVNNYLTHFTYKGKEKIFTPYYYNTVNGFNISKSKTTMSDGKIEYVPTKRWNGEYRKTKTRLDGKFKKDGTPYIRKKGNPTYLPNINKWEYHYETEVFTPITDIQGFYEYFNEYRQITTGLTHNERQVIVCDFDEDLSSDDPIVPFNENTIPKLEKICEEYNIPHFTYLEHHTDSEHFQIGWVLDEPIYWNNKKSYYHLLYSKIISTLSVVFHSDRGFKGWWIKNPNCLDFTDTYWFNDCVSRKQFIDIIVNISNSLSTENTTEITELTEEITNYDECSESSLDNVKSVVISNPNDFTGRNDYLKDHLRDYIWDYKRTNGVFPSYEAALNKGLLLSNEIGQITGDGPEPIKYITNTTKSVYKWSVKNYRDTDNSDRREFGNLVKSSRKEENILDVYLFKSQGMSNKEITEKMGMTKSSMDKYMKVINSGMFNFYEDDCDCISTLGIQKTKELFSICCINEHRTDKLNSYINDCVRIIDKFYYLGNNRIVVIPKDNSTSI